MCTREYIEMYVDGPSWNRMLSSVPINTLLGLFCRRTQKIVTHRLTVITNHQTVYGGVGVDFGFDTIVHAVAISYQLGTSVSCSK
jgi:hypothetical protein